MERCKIVFGPPRHVNLDSTVVHGKRAIRIAAAVVVCLGIFEFASGLAVFSFVENVTIAAIQVGGWWGAILPTVAGMMGIMSDTKRVVYRAFVLSAIGAVFNVVALMIDANAFFVYVEPLATCLDTKTMELYGDLENSDNVHSCYKSLDTTPGCVCAQKKTTDQQSCFGANLRHARSDCGDILSTYTTNLQLSMIVCLTLVIAVPFFCGLTRKSVHFVSDSIFDDLERSLENPLRDSYSGSELETTTVKNAVNSGPMARSSENTK